MSRKILLFLAALAAGSAQAGLIHRWSFNTAAGAAPAGTTVVDSVAGAQGFVRGGGATFSGTALTLPGTTIGNVDPATISAYVDLPNGIISSKTSLTVEVWATQISARNWQRLFDFGRTNLVNDTPRQGAGAAPGEILSTATLASGGTSSSDNLMLAINRGSAANQQRLVARLDGAAELGVNTDLTLTPGTQYHFALTYAAGAGVYGAVGGQVAWYLNGALAATLDVNFRLSSIEDVNNWLGRSQYGGDSNANVAYDEFRIHDFAMSAAQINTSRTSGANAVFAPPVAQADPVTMLRQQKARIAVLANDTGNINAGTVAIVTPPQFGTAVADATGRVLYTHTTGAPAGDSFTYRVSGGGGLSNTATVTITFSEGMRFATSALNVPATPPSNAYQLVAAFPALTFDQPVCMRTAPGETQRLFVCQKTGLLRVVSSVTAANPTASNFLNLPALLGSRTPVEAVDSGGECGLLGLAFHPQYATNRQFFIFYSVTKSGARLQRVSRFLTQAGNPDAADPGSERILIEQPDEMNNHNGGDLHFGADGYLYVSLGDEGNQDDSFNNSQRIDKDFFSSILRIDVNLEGAEIAGGNAGDPDDNNVPPTAHATSVPLYSGLPAFEVPIDNPYVHTSVGANGQFGTWNGMYNGAAIANLALVRREIWASGMRNPWRMSFDPPTGLLWVGDVGGGVREEVNIVTRGGNYGWALREGTGNGPKSAQAPANFNTLYGTFPIYDYAHGSGTLQGNSITGGFVYRGSRFPALQGLYFFADYVSGNIWTMQQNGSGVQRILGEGGIVAFAPDPSNGDVLLADVDGGRILRLTTGTVGSYPQTLTDTGLFADFTDLSPSPGLVPYTVNLPFWSDNAIKTRWMVVPNGTSQFTWSKDGLWTLPTGTIWVKHFDVEMQRGVPASKKRIETRVLVKNGGGAYGVSYRWNDGGTEATLVEDAGVDFPLAVTENGNPVPQTWSIPSRAQCMICHTPQAGHALSFNTRQLNLANNMLGFSGNQLTTLQQQGYFTNNPGSPNLLPRHVGPLETSVSTEAKVRSYIAVNCSYCHKSGGTAPTAWDGRPELTLAQTGLVNGSAANSGSDPLNKLVVPGDTAHSIVLHRVAVTGGFTRMPPIGSNMIDTANVTLLTNWINGELDDRLTYDAWRIANFEPDNDPSGASGMDPDNDGVTNQDEFLAGTNPKSGSSALRPLVSGNPLKLSFTLPANRSFRIDSSTNLGSWTPWDVPGNQGLPVSGGLIEFAIPIADPQRFFRVEVMEN